MQEIENPLAEKKGLSVDLEARWRDCTKQISGAPGYMVETSYTVNFSSPRKHRKISEYYCTAETLIN